MMVESIQIDRTVISIGNDQIFEGIELVACTGVGSHIVLLHNEPGRCVFVEGELDVLSDMDSIGVAQLGGLLEPCPGL